MKYTHYGRQYGIAIKNDTRDAYIIEYFWSTAGEADNNKVKLWGNGGEYTDIKSGNQFAFTLTFIPSNWI